jgi:inhibitor of cysteine peptidase
MQVDTMNYSVILVGIGIICLMSIMTSGCLGTSPEKQHPVQTPPPTPTGIPVQAGHLVVNEDQNNSTIEMVVNNILTLELKENPTTGFQWNLTTTPGIITIDDAYIPTSPQLIGSGGVHKWDIKTAQPGTQVIKATYMRSWEPVTGNETSFSLTVVVRNP